MNPPKPIIYASKMQKNKKQKLLYRKGTVTRMERIYEMGEKSLQVLLLFLM
jgi:hypothetical protein